MKNLASDTKFARFTLPEGDAAEISFPTPLTDDSIEMLVDLCALMFRGMKRDAVRWTAQQNAELEYQSWFPIKGNAT